MNFGQLDKERIKLNPCSLNSNISAQTRTTTNKIQH